MRIAEFLRFATVGLAQNAANVGVFALLVAGGLDYRLAAVVSSVTALLVSYRLNGRWTFAAGPAPDRHRLTRYAMVFVGAALLGLAILTAFSELGGWKPVPAQVVSILIVAPLSYLAQRRFAFRV